MKKIVLLTAVATLGLMGLSASNVQAAAVTTNGLVSTFAITGLFSPLGDPVTTSNSSGTVVTDTYTTKSVKITTKDMLNLLADEFNTTFPVGAQLAFSLNGNEGFVVLDKLGNVFLNVSTNPADSSYRFALTNNSTSSQTISGKVVETTKPSSTNSVANFTETFSDYSIIYKDGNGNNFHFIGVIALKENIFEDSTSSMVKSATIILSGSGGGTFFDPVDSTYHNGVLTKAKWSAKGKDFPGGL